MIDSPIHVSFHALSDTFKSLEFLEARGQAIEKGCQSPDYSVLPRRPRHVHTRTTDDLAPLRSSRPACSRPGCSRPGASRPGRCRPGRFRLFSRPTLTLPPSWRTRLRPKDFVERNQDLRTRHTHVD